MPDLIGHPLWSKSKMCVRQTKPSEKPKILPSESGENSVTLGQRRAHIHICVFVRYRVYVSAYLCVRVLTHKHIRVFTYKYAFMFIYIYAVMHL